MRGRAGVFIIVTAVVLLGGALYVFIAFRERLAPPPTTSVEGFTFQAPKKSAHYESNTPGHGAVLAGVPVNVVVDFNFDLAESSVIAIEQEGKDYGAGETIVDLNKLALRRRMNPEAPDGVYTVRYKACWPDRSCHKGQFQFAVLRARRAAFADLLGRREVTVRLSDISFAPRELRVTRGTKVRWVNDDPVVHYINTDSHPAHTYYKAENSQAIPSGGSYAFVFNEPGIYPYHCSAHAEDMTGMILVEE